MANMSYNEKDTPIDKQVSDSKYSNEIPVKLLIVKIKDYYRYLSTRWVTIVLFSMLGGGLGIAYSILKRPVYLAVSTFVLEDSGGSGGALGQYSGLASMVGVDLGGGGNGIFQGDNIIELYKSRLMLQKTLLSEVVFNGKRQLLIERYIDFNELRDKWKDKPELNHMNFERGTGKFTRIQDSIITSIINDVNTRYLTVSKPDKKSSIFKVEVKAKDELFAQAFNSQIVQNVSDFYVQTKTKKALADLDILLHQSDSIRKVLNSSIIGVATAVDANPNANLSRQILRVPSQKRQVDVEANRAILTELIKNLEISRVSLRKETPLIQLIDEPVLPLEVIRYGKFKSALVGSVLAAFLIASMLLLNKIFKSILE